VVEEEEFHLHHSMLMFTSPVLYAMFSQDFKEGIDKRAQLPGKNKEVFLFFLNCIYPLQELPAEDEYDNRLLSEVLEYSKEYIADSVVLVVDQLLAVKVGSLKPDNSNFKECMEILLVADTYDLQQTRRLCVLFMSWLKRPDWSTDVYQYEQSVTEKLSVQTQYDLLAGEVRKLGIPSDPTDRYGLTLSVHEVRNLNCLVGAPVKVKDHQLPPVVPIHVGNVFEFEEIHSPRSALS
jgi:hypothetical protein